MDGATSLITKANLCFFKFHQELASVAYEYELRLLFFLRLWNMWNRLHGNNLALQSEHVDVPLASMGSIDVVLPWSP